nr:agmatine deiminase family protein [Adhaeribacter terrigena]
MLEGTKDIWCRDFMPLQVAMNEFIQFRYTPDYCDDSAWEHTVTKPVDLKLDPRFRIQNSDLILDGGNVVRYNGKVILTDKVLKDNPGFSKSDMIELLKELLRAEEIFIIPQQPYDMTGHADGMVRFLNDRTMLVSDYQNESISWKKKYAAALNNTKLNVIDFPTVVLDEKNEYGDYTARGCYINFAQVGNTILLPFFDLPEDQLALKELVKLYPNQKIIHVESNEIAQDGGVLNCITWNIKR